MTGQTEAIERRLRDRLQAERVDIVDDSARHAGHPGAASGGHFTVTVVSPKFAGLTSIQRHRMVYDALDEMLRTHIHALSIRALAPNET